MNVTLLSEDRNTLQGNLFPVSTRAEDSHSRYARRPADEVRVFIAPLGVHPLRSLPRTPHPLAEERRLKQMWTMTEA